MVRVFTILALLAASPAWARWDYCYNGETPEGVNAHIEMPPRTFGFEIALLPHSFKRLCGHPAQAESAHIRRIVADYLECPPDSDLALRIETVLTAPESEMFATYFDQSTVQENPMWRNVCAAAHDATIQDLAFGDTWYFDSDTPKQDRARIVALTDALEALSKDLAEDDK